MGSKLYYRFYNDGDCLGEGESSPTGCYHTYYERLCRDLPFYYQYMTITQERAKASMKWFDLSWITTQEDMEDWINAIIQHVLQCEKKKIKI